MNKPISVTALIVLGAFFSSTLAGAAAPEAVRTQWTAMADYYTIASVTVEEIQEEPGLEWTANWPFMDELFDTPPGGGGLDESLIVLDQIINFGKKIWAIVEANKPVVNYKTDRADAMPAGIQTWQNLETWNAPQAKVYRATYKNLFGMTVVDFAFRVLFTSGGSYKGKGQYLTHVTIVPANLNVAWGYNFDAQATIPSVVNNGTQAEPVAGMELLMNWTVKTVMKHHQSTMSFFVRGDGQFTNLSPAN